MNRDELMDALEVKYPKLFIRTTEEFNGTKNGIWTSGEDSTKAADGFDLFDYYATDFEEKRYVFGVHKEIGEFLEKNGWFAEWYDAGTLMIYEM